MNSDAAIYGGSNLGNGGEIQAEDVASHGLPASVALLLPPLATLILRAT
jgi:1,4-alpha-glucan branching enzyme